MNIASPAQPLPPKKEKYVKAVCGEYIWNLKNRN